MALFDATSCFRGRISASKVLVLGAIVTLTILYVLARRPSDVCEYGASDGAKIDQRLPVWLPAGLFSHAERRCWQFADGDCVTRSPDGRLEPRYADFIRTHITAPSPGSARQLDSPPTRKHFSQVGESQFLESNLLLEKQNGFFVEAGALNGETYSNTLYYEISKNWTGLLVEANPDLHRSMLAKNRQAYVFGGCLSPSNRPQLYKFNMAGAYGGLVGTMAKIHADVIKEVVPSATISWVQCFPLQDLLDAIGVNTVDYLSLDVEGGELDILRTINFNRTNIGVLTIEYEVIRDVAATAKKLEAMRQLFAVTGLYHEIGKIRNLDVVFRRNQTV